MYVLKNGDHYEKSCGGEHTVEGKVASGRTIRLVPNSEQSTKFRDSAKEVKQETLQIGANNLVELANKPHPDVLPLKQA